LRGAIAAPQDGKDKAGVAVVAVVEKEHNQQRGRPASEKIGQAAYQDAESEDTEEEAEKVGKDRAVIGPKLIGEGSFAADDVGEGATQCRFERGKGKEGVIHIETWITIEREPVQ
jgi:hypothetical protein